MSEVRTLLERKQKELQAPAGSFERLILRRDRKRRNQRIAAGVVGIAMFVAAVWIVTSGLSLDRTQTPVAPRPADTGPTQTPSPSPRDSPPAIVWSTGRCSDSATWRLGDRPLGDGFKVWFEVHRSPVGHSWRIVLTAWRGLPNPGDDGVVFFRGIRVAAEDGEVEVHRRVSSLWGRLVFAKAIDTQTGQACKVRADLW